jgi:hypothetical protein
MTNKHLMLVTVFSVFTVSFALEMKLFHTVFPNGRVGPSSSAPCSGASSTLVQTPSALRPNLAMTSLSARPFESTKGVMPSEKAGQPIQPIRDTAPPLAQGGAIGKEGELQNVPMKVGDRDRTAPTVDMRRHVAALGKSALDTKGQPRADEASRTLQGATWKRNASAGTRLAITTFTETTTRQDGTRNDGNAKTASAPTPSETSTILTTSTSIDTTKSTKEAKPWTATEITAPVSTPTAFVTRSSVAKAQPAKRAATGRIPSTTPKIAPLATSVTSKPEWNTVLHEVGGHIYEAGPLNSAAPPPSTPTRQIAKLAVTAQTPEEAAYDALVTAKAAYDVAKAAYDADPALAALTVAGERYAAAYADWVNAQPRPCAVCAPCNPPPPPQPPPPLSTYTPVYEAPAAGPLPSDATLKGDPYWYKTGDLKCVLVAVPPSPPPAPGWLVTRLGSCPGSDSPYTRYEKVGVIAP